jgi:hypothetical protein
VADLGGVLSAATAYGDEREAETRAELQPVIEGLTAERDAARKELADHMATHPPEGPTKAELRAAYGVCVPFIPNPTTYADLGRWFGELAAMGVTQIRGAFGQNNAKAREALPLCRQHGIKWLMVLVPEDWSVNAAGVATRMKWLHDNGWHDVVLGFENINEPDHERGGGQPPADWAQRVVTLQKAIHANRNLYFPGVPVLTSSLHDLVQDATDGAGYVAISEAGPYADAVAMHSYPKGKEVTTALDERLARVDKGFPEHPVWLTETGWSTYTKTGSSGPVPTTEADAATYGAQVPATIHEHPRVDKAFRFELLDDPGASNPEANYGLIRTDWSAKPEADALRAVLKG